MRFNTLTLLTLALAFPTDVAACSCAAPRNAVEASRATLVIRGRVMQISYRDLGPPNLDDDWSTFRMPIAVEFQVDESWRGRASRTMIVTTGMGGGDCGFPFRVGLEYLVPIHESGADEPVTDICSGVEPLWKAPGTLMALGKGLAPLPNAIASHSEAERLAMQLWGAYSLLAALASGLILGRISARVSLSSPAVSPTNHPNEDQSARDST